MACLKASDVCMCVCVCGPKRKHLCILILNSAVFVKHAPDYVDLLSNRPKKGVPH